MRFPLGLRERLGKGFCVKLLQGWLFAGNFYNTGRWLSVGYAEFYYGYLRAILENDEARLCKGSA